jgi:hypothetical protein
LRGVEKRRIPPTENAWTYTRNHSLARLLADQQVFEGVGAWAVLVVEIA